MRNRNWKFKVLFWCWQQRWW